MTNFPTWIPDCKSHSLALSDLFISSSTSICSTMPSLHWETLIMFLSQLSLILPHTHKEMPRFIAKTILMLIDSLCDHLRDVPWQNIFKLNASAAASELCKWFQVEIGPYIPHCMYQVLSLIISIVLENLFHLNQQNKSSEPIYLSIYLSIYLYINLC